MEGFAAAAAAFFIGIAEYESAFELLLHEIHLRADEEHDSLGVDQHTHAVTLNYFIELGRLVGILNGVRKP